MAKYRYFRRSLRCHLIAPKCIRIRELFDGEEQNFVVK